jgi:L-lactate dehydrogenase complex protein LldG
VGETEEAHGMSGLNPQSRDIILGRIRRALGAGADDVERRVSVQRRLSAPTPGPIPARTQGSRAELVAQLKTRLEGLAATAEVVPLAEIPCRVADFLKRNNLPARVRSGTDPLLAGLDWSTAPSLTIERGPADPKDEVSLTHAVAAAAETGTLVLVSGSDNPTTLNFLPETEIIVVRAEDVEGSYEATWGKIRALYGDRTMPRTVNWVSGPSRTGDIDQMLVLGAHGPRRLHVVIAEG